MSCYSCVCAPVRANFFRDRALGVKVAQQICTSKIALFKENLCTSTTAATRLEKRSHLFKILVASGRYATHQASCICPAFADFISAFSHLN